MDVHDLSVGCAAAVSDPRTGAGAHDGLERCDHSARGELHQGTSVVAGVMYVGLPVRHHDHLWRTQLVAHHLVQRLRGPILAIVDFEPLAFLDFPHYLPYL